jgi:predicted phage terminase large subunit-like protein
MKLDKDLIHGFAGSILSRRYDNATPTPACHMEWWELCSSDHPFVAIAAPRGHGKSTAITHAYILASVLFRAHKFVLLISDTETQAVDFLRDIKDELMTNEDLIELFGIKDFRKDTETDIIVTFNDGDSFRILVKGSGQKVRGTKWDHHRPDLIVCDDLENEELVYNKDRREKFRKWFNGALLPSRSRDGVVRIVGTILHMDSLLNRLMPEESRRGTVVEPLRTYNFSKGSAWASIRYRAHSEDFKEILWPTRYDKQYFETERQKAVDDGMPEIYAQEFLNYPIDEGTAYFRRDDFIEMEDRHRAIHKIYYAACDFAVSTYDRSDYTVISIVGVDDKGMLYVEDIRRGRWDSLQIIEEMFSVESRYKPELFVVEKGTIEKSIGPILRMEMLSRNIHMNLYPLTPTTDKTSRARGIQKIMRAGAIRFDKQATWYLDLEDEMVRFPKARHDDQVDALSWVGIALDRVRQAETPKELEDEYYAELEKDEVHGRSLVTGY